MHPQKSMLRERVLARREALGARWREQASARITARLLDVPIVRGASIIAGTSAFGTEFDTAAFNRAVLASGRTLLLPLIHRQPRHLSFHVVADPDIDLRSGPWGIREPDPDRCAEVPIDRVDCLVIPGLAFDLKGHRLGYGGGFYDRVLVQVPPATVVAPIFSMQLLPALPVEDHDRPVRLLVTESATFRLR
ncbi:MAG: 5-formyltetrahydrofolate cyclo-ligase [Burkholderiales bacterium]|nr:5-formyltetrahydrofolate cyclo-ligase [Burkholderiales bacterium]